MLNRHFLSVSVRPFYGAHQTALTWQVADGPPSGRFTVFRSRTGVNSWEGLGFVQNLNYFVDSYAQFPGRFADWHYKVVREVEDQFVESPSVSTLGRLMRHEFGAARFIMRQEVQVMRRFEQLVLLQQKMAGPPCPRCYNDITDQGYGSSRCPCCYGTKLEGGYYPPVRINTRQLTSLENKRLDAPGGEGSADPEQLIYRMIAFPMIHKDDLLINEETDRRYLVETVENYQLFGKVPLVNTVHVRQLNSSDIRTTRPLGKVQQQLAPCGCPPPPRMPPPVPVLPGIPLSEASQSGQFREFSYEFGFEFD